VVVPAGERLLRRPRAGARPDRGVLRLHRPASSCSVSNGLERSF
jgi:hypothetical protein